MSVATPNTALVRTELWLPIGAQGYLPPHNFTVSLPAHLDLARSRFCRLAQV